MSLCYVQDRGKSLIVLHMRPVKGNMPRSRWGKKSQHRTSAFWIGPQPLAFKIGEKIVGGGLLRSVRANQSSTSRVPYRAKSSDSLRSVKG